MKALISFAVTAKLICAFVFAYAKSRFYHDAAHIPFSWDYQKIKSLASKEVPAGLYLKWFELKESDDIFSSSCWH